jgi:hypothetical protein
MTGASDQRAELLRQELSNLDENIRNYDEIRSKIKGWAVGATTATAGFAAARGRPGIYLAGVVALLGFWVLEAYARGIQRSFIRKRIDAVDFLTSEEFPQALAGDDAGLVSTLRRTAPAIGHSRSESLRIMVGEAFGFGTVFLYAFLAALLAGVALVT